MILVLPQVQRGLISSAPTFLRPTSKELGSRFSNRIREIRIQRGFKSQEEFADYCKLHRTFIGHLETGRKDFRLTTIIRIAEALGVTMEDLFAGLEAGKPHRLKRATRADDIDAMMREFSVLERSVLKLKEYLSQEKHAKSKRAHRQ